MALSPEPPQSLSRRGQTLHSAPTPGTSAAGQAPASTLRATLKKTAQSGSARSIDKHLFEAGLQCAKRLYLDSHGEGGESLQTSRRLLSESGRELLALACRAFPKGTEVKGEGAAAIAETRALLEAKTPVVFGAAFQQGGVEARTDILLRNGDGSYDIYEVKSGTKIKQRYLQDVALQMAVLLGSGLTVRKANVLHLNPKYVHTEGEEHSVQKLFRSTDVTDRATRLLPRTQEQLVQFRDQMADESVLELPMGTWCTQPFTCPHLPRCRSEAQAHPLRDLPDLTREQESALHQEAIETIDQLDQKRPGLTFRQRRTIQAVQEGGLVLEPFVKEELRALDRPLHCLAVGMVVDVLPRFTGQKPWRRIPYAWACHTLHQDGRVEKGSFVHLERSDPRPKFLETLAAWLRHSGVVLNFGHDAFELTRSLLTDLPAMKTMVRAVLARRHLDLSLLLESAVFHPDLHENADLATYAKVVLGDTSASDLAIGGGETALAAVEKATAPRVRQATRDKTAADVLAWVEWQSRTLLALFGWFAEGQSSVPQVIASAPAGVQPAVALRGRLGRSGELEAVPATPPAEAVAEPARKSIGRRAAGATRKPEVKAGKPAAARAPRRTRHES